MKNFIPTIWSARLNEKNEKNYVILQDSVINRDYEGEILDAGDTVNITGLGDITIVDYTGGNLGAAQELTTTQVKLVIDQAKAFNFAVDDIEVAQSNLNLIDGAATVASGALSEKAEMYVAGLYTEFKHKIGTDESPIEIKKDNIFDQIVDLGAALDKESVPRDGRFLLVAPDFYAMLQKSSIIQRPDLTGTIQNGEIGKVGGFTVYVTNHLVHGTAQHAIAGHKSGWTYAEQIAKVKAYEPENSFKQAVKGLHLYGAKVVKPENLAVLSYKLV